MISETICICAHEKAYHYPNMKACSVLKCSCQDYTPEINRMQSMEVCKTRLAAQEAKQEFHQKNRCPKCGLGVNAILEFHQKKFWYQRNCKLKIKEEHLHLICDACKAHWGLPTKEFPNYGEIKTK